jgi:hypothetical protein
MSTSEREEMRGEVVRGETEGTTKEEDDEEGAECVRDIPTAEGTKDPEEVEVLGVLDECGILEEGGAMADRLREICRCVRSTTGAAKAVPRRAPETS